MCTISKEECSAGNWQEIGKNDGTKGYFKNYLQSHQKSCEAANSEVATELYSLGWEQGHKSYCTAENGYNAGLSGLSASGICEVDQFPDYNQQFKIGHKVASLKSQSNEIQEQIDTVNKDGSTWANISRAYSILNGRSPTESLDRQKREIDEKILVIDNDAPGGPKLINSYAAEAAFTQSLVTRFYPENPNTFLNKTGAFVGTFFGFGIGHAIQGRYFDSGWKWTLGELATFSVAAANSDSTCSQEEQDPFTGMTKQHCVKNGKDPNVALGTMGLWLGVRVWQSIDLWTFSDKENKQSNNDSMILFKPNGVAWIQRF